MRIETAEQFEEWRRYAAPVHLVQIDGVPGVALVWEDEDGEWHGIRPVTEDDGPWSDLPSEVRQSLAVRVDDFGALVDDENVTPFTALWPVRTDLALSALQERVGAINVANGWWEDLPSPHGVTDRVVALLALITTEVAEGIEEVRNGRAVDETYYSDDAPDKPEGVPSELADVVIRALDFADRYGIDLEASVLEKLEYNATRGHRHGGKTL